MKPKAESPPPSGEREGSKPDEARASAPASRPAATKATGLGEAVSFTAATAAALLLLILLGGSLLGQGPDLSLFTYVIAPAPVALGVVVLLHGLRRAQRAARSKAGAALPRRRRRLATGLAVAATLLLGWTSYEAVVFSGSSTFCGELCHTPMAPQHQAHRSSPHAEVPCVECHVGQGAWAYVKSKIMNVEELGALLQDDYERPIVAARAELPPVRDTCERCHPPEQLQAPRSWQRLHLRFDATSSPERISLTPGSGKGDTVRTDLHRAMVVENTITFAATGAGRRQIPWIAVKRPDGSVAEYTARSAKLSAAEIAALPRHTFSCLDCHSRVGHDFRPPLDRIDSGLAGGLFPKRLPWLKQLLAQAVHRPYPSGEAAVAGIREEILGFYEEHHPRIYVERRTELDQVVSLAQEIRAGSTSAVMSVSWTTYPDNTGHRYSAGCFRCHDGDHVSGSGEVLANDCATTCHSQPRRELLQPPAPKAAPPPGSWHPWEHQSDHVAIEAHDRALCHQCHGERTRFGGGCDDCH